MADVYVRSYFNRPGGYQVAPGFFAIDASGNIIIDQTTIAGLNNRADGSPLTYYSDPNASDGSETPIGNALLLPSPDFLSNAAAAGALYGQETLAGESAQKLGLDASGMYVGADDLLISSFYPKYGTFDAQYADGATGPFFPAFTDAGNFAAGVFFGAAHQVNPSIGLNDALQAFGWANTYQGAQDESGPFGISQHGLSAIIQGYQLATGVDPQAELNVLPVGTLEPWGLNPNSFVASPVGVTNPFDSSQSIDFSNPLDTSGQSPYGNLDVTAFDNAGNSALLDQTSAYSTAIGTFGDPGGIWTGGFQAPATGVSIDTADTQVLQAISAIDTFGAPADVMSDTYQAPALAVNYDLTGSSPPIDNGTSPTEIDNYPTIMPSAPPSSDAGSAPSAADSNGVSLTGGISGGSGGVNSVSLGASVPIGGGSVDLGDILNSIGDFLSNFLGSIFSFSPIVLDLANTGINITQLTSSNTFFDMTGDGYQNLTAWAGAGDGVLFVDTSGAGQLTQANQMIFTDWDPSATSDMQALEDVFDTNHDGSLDAGDADFADFFVEETNANGTKSVYSLAQLGITSINLNANATNIALPDGSSIDGETTYTTSSGATGTAATVTFATDPNGYVVATTTSTNSDGSTTILNVAENADGSIAYQNILNTGIATSGGTTTTTKTLSDLNSEGVVETIQTDVIVAVSGGTTTETLTNYAGGAIQSDGELTASGTTGAEELNSTTTTTSTSGGVQTVTILRDQTGGWTNQEEVDTTYANGSTQEVVSDLNPDSTVSAPDVSNVTTSATTLSGSGSSRTVTSLVDGNAAESTTSIDSIVVNSATQQTETVTDSVGTTVTSLVTTVTQTAANSVTRTITSDLTDGFTLDETTTQTTVTDSGGSTTTQIDQNGNGSFRDETLTTVDPTGLLKTTYTDSNGAGTSGAPVWTQIVTDNTVVNGDGSRTETVTMMAGDNTTELSQTITDDSATGAGRTATTYGNGDGEVTQTEVVTVNGGVTTDTVDNLNGDGSLANATVTTTQAGGLSNTTETDSTGAGTASAPVFDHTTTDVTTSAGGVSTETVTEYGAAVTASDEIENIQTVTSANGLTVTTYDDFTGANGIADGAWDQITVDSTVVNGDGSLTETITVDDGNNNLLETIVKNTSANRQLVTTTITLGATGLAKTVETVATLGNGMVVDTVLHEDSVGDILNATVTTTSADGLTKIVQDDIQGQSAAVYAASGLSFDTTTTQTTVINANGSRTETTNVTSVNGGLVSTSSVLTSANGLSITTMQDPYATAHYASQTTNISTLNADGSITKVISDYNYDGGRIDDTTTITSASGLSTTTLHDFDGNGVVDQSTTDVTTINANGTQTEVVTDYTGGTTGTVRDVTTTTSGIILAGLGQETTITRQSNGSIPFYQVETIAPSANGTVVDTTQTYASQGGTLLGTKTVTTSANGLTTVAGTAVNADVTEDFWTSDSTTLNPNGSQTETVANYNKSGLISETVTTATANGLFKTTDVDADGALNGSSAVFSLVTTDDTVLNSNGSRTETVTNTNTNGWTISQTVTTTSADKQTIATDQYLDETGTITNIDQVETVQTQGNGSVVATIVSYGSTNALLSTVTKTTSGNGLVKSTTYQNAAGSIVDTQSDTTTYDSNGDGGTLDDFEDTDVVNSTTTLKTSVKTQSVANDESDTITLTLTGALASTIAASLSLITNTSIAIADTGISTETRTDKINGATSANDTTTIVTSANGLAKTTSTAIGTASPYIVAQDTTNLDGSQTATTTYYDPASLSLVLEQTTVNTSWDGRTVTTTTQSDYDGINQSGTTFAGPSYNTQTETQVENAGGSKTTTISGTGAFGAPAYTQVIDTATNADSSVTATIQNYDGNGVLTGQTVEEVAPDGLINSFIVDGTGNESIANLDAAAADLLSGSALPSTLLPTDVLGLSATILNADGSSTLTDTTAFGNSLTNLRTQSVTTTSANALTTVTKIDNDGNGVYEQVDTKTVAPDGSFTDTYADYGDTVATENTMSAENVNSGSANGLVDTMQTFYNISGNMTLVSTDTTADLPDVNGSYQWSRVVTSAASTLTVPLGNGSASHDIDANGVDTWSWNDSLGGTSGTITIDVATEEQDIAIANAIYMTLLGRDMDDSETQFLAQYINNGVLDRVALAKAIITSTAYLDEFGVREGLQVADAGPNGVLSVELVADLMNALGRAPTAEEMAIFGAQIGSSSSTGVTIAIPVAQYATDVLATNNYNPGDPNQGLTGLSPAWTDPTGHWLNIAGTTGSYFGSWLEIIGEGSGINNISGNDNIIVGGRGGTETVNVTGYNDAVVDDGDIMNIVGSGLSVMLLAGNDTITGNSDQIGQFAYSTLTLSSGDMNDSISIALSPDTTSTKGWTFGSNASINVANGIGSGPGQATSGGAWTILGSNNSIVLDGNDAVNVDGSNNTVSVVGSGDTLWYGYVNDATNTFVFQPNFGQDTFEYYNHTLNASDLPTISLPASEFANFAAVLADATQSSNGDSVITAANGDQLTIGVGTSTLATLSANFTFH